MSDDDLEAFLWIVAGGLGLLLLIIETARTIGG